ncbi:MAG: SdrD B-like domain-containing protein [Planctomycetota bacterium]
MIRNTLLSLASTALFGTVALAQNCTDNFYPITLVDAFGVPAPVVTDPQTSQSFFQFASEDVYMAFPANLPSGTYYVHVTDPIGGADMVLSTNDPMDRFVQVTNTNGVISLSLPMSSNSPVTGLGLGGQGQSLLLQPFTTNPAEPCSFKAWLGDYWDLSNGPTNPYLILGGFNPNTNDCAVRSYEGFRIGDGSLTDVTGCVFRDANSNGVQDPGEAGLAGWTVNLVTNGLTTSQVTDGNGDYRFADVAAANYTVELVLQSGFTATTPVNYQIEVCGCADVEVNCFGVVSTCLPCDGHTIGYWRNCHGLQLVQQHGILATLPALGIVNGCGQRVAPATLSQYSCWLQGANSVNMAYMLSAQLVAMHNNVLVGFVDPNCVLEEPGLGQLTVADLLQRAVTSLWAHPLTTWCSPYRNEQALLKNALDHANNNLNWVNACGCNTGCGGGGGGQHAPSCGGGQSSHGGCSPYRRRHHS